MKILLATVALSILPIAANGQDKPDGKVLFRCQDVGHPVQEPLGTVKATQSRLPHTVAGLNPARGKTV
jgi:hypothetical protein